MGDTITASSASSAATALLPAAQLTRSIDKGTTSKDGRQLSLQVYKEDMEQVVDLEKVLQELIQLQLLYTNTVAPLKESLVEPVEVNVGARNESPDIKLNTIQLIYRILVQLTTTVNDLAQSNETASVVLLNTVKLVTSLKEVFNRFVAVYRNNSNIINIYFTFVGISTDIYLAFLLIMTASTLSVRSFVSSSLVLLACLLALALFMPLIIMIVSTILVVSISISLASILVQSASAAFWDNFDTRTWLTAVADRIPPSVGRVEVSHEKQRKDHEALTAAKTINP